MLSKNQIRKAGKIFKSITTPTLEEIEFARTTLTYWRSAHGKVIEKFQDCLIQKSIEIDSKAIIAKRLKRTPSIVRKLRRLNHIQLSTMQDIAGMRVIVKSMPKLRKLIKALKSTSFEQELKNEDDYINEPKKSGYRGIHLIFKYNNKDEPELDGLLVEVQIRTEIQHAWATAVETMGTYLNTQLKFDEGKQKWLKYFALTSSAFSYIEKTNPVPNYLDLTELETYKKTLYEFNYNLIKEKLGAFSEISDIICDKEELNGKYNLVLLNIKDKKVSINVFEPSDLDLANEDYTELEKKYSENDNFQVALVSTENILELRDAYPNYFLDTNMFIKKMSTIKMKLNKF
jgi:putative GTP pyrophosphokinase